MGNAEKDTCEYMALMNSKIEFLLKSLSLVNTPYISWIDAGISKIFQNPDKVFSTISTLNISHLNNVLIPGSYKRNVSFEDLKKNIWWVFLGDFFICNKEIVLNFYEESIKSVSKFIKAGYIAWEVNVWIDVANNSTFFEWYYGDHNDRIVNIPLSWRSHLIK